MILIKIQSVKIFKVLYARKCRAISQHILSKQNEIGNSITTNNLEFHIFDLYRI